MEFVSRQPNIYILSGKAKSGKSLAADIICGYYKDKQCIQLSYSYYLKDYAKRVLGWDGSEQDKPRDFLQQVGVQLIGKKIDSKLLIRRLLEDVEVFSYFYDIIVVTDARFVDEIELPKQKFSHVTTIRIAREMGENNLSEKQKQHETEVALDCYHDFDYLVYNNNSYDDFEREIVSILEGVCPNA